MESAFVDCEYVGECELRAVRSTLESGWLSGGVRPGRNALGWDAAINPARLARWNEARILSVAKQLEVLRPWRRHAPLGRA